MNKLLAAAAAAGLLAFAAPASAQSWRDRDDHYRDRDYRHGYNARDHYRFGVWIDRQQGELEARIYNGLRTGRLSHWEARRFQDRLDETRWLEARYRRNGLTRGEYMDLSRRLDRLEAALMAELYDPYRYRG